MRIKAAAKINLALDVTGVLPNGYHSIESVFQTVGIYDEVEVELAGSGIITLNCEQPEAFMSADKIPCDERNIAYKAADKFLRDNSLNRGCRIHIKKGIPSQAGMGGGSTDAAAVLYCLHKLTGKSISAPEKLGADVPFFLTGGTAYVEGIGEKIVPIADFSGKILLIAKGAEGVSTAVAYRAIDMLENPPHPQTRELVQAIQTAPDEAYRYFGNLFESAVNLGEVADIKARMLSHGALSSAMTGSGSAVFGLFSDRKSAEICSRELAENGFFSQVCETVANSFTEI